jgi:hypothetical protein
MELASDMLELINSYDTAILVSGDGDFSDTVKRLQSRGKRVEVVSFRSSTSNTLIDAANKYLDLETIRERIEQSSSSSKIQVSNGKTLISVFTPKPSITPQSTTINLFTILNQAKLRPLPEHRETVIKELIDLFAATKTSETLNQIKSTLATKLSGKVQISNTQLRDILNALMRSRCFLDHNGKVLSGIIFNQSVSTLISLDPVVLNNKCIEIYARKILSVEPNYFENPENIRKFEQTVGGKVPGQNIIDLLKNSIKS